MSKDLLAKIEAEFGQLSKGHKKIASFILSHYDRAAYMTAGKLGQTVGVSESTVVRFATELGYEGYPEFQDELEEIIRNKLTSAQRIAVGQSQIGPDEVLQKVLQRDIDKIEETLKITSADDFYGAVDAILSAKTIYILGARSAAPLADLLGYYLNFMNENVQVIRASTTSEVFEKSFRISKGDVFIAISFPRYSKQTYRATQFAGDKGADVIAITDCAASPLVPLAKYKLFAASGMLSFIDSLTAPLSLINALLVAVGMQLKEQLTDTFNELEKVWEEYQIYEKTT